MTSNIIKKLALIISGIAYIENKINKINFMHSILNYKQYIYAYFLNLGYTIDTFIITDDIYDNNIRNILLKTYNPVKSFFFKQSTRNEKIKKIIEICLDYSRHNNIQYETCLITRFDLLFQKSFFESNIKLEMFNVVSELENIIGICDNFYVFPFSFLIEFYNIIKDTTINHHCIKNNISNFTKINYILNERCLVAELNFYKIVRNQHVINKPIQSFRKFMFSKI